MSGIQDGIILDLSEWQYSIDFEKLSKVPNLKGVIIRVQSGYTHIDSRYEEYVAGCRKYNIPFMTYAYFKGANVADSIKEATNAFNLMDKDSKGMVVDIEEVTTTNPADLVPAGQAFVDYFKNKGVRTGLYSGAYFYEAHGLANIHADFKWLAAYGANDGNPHTEPAKDGDDLWQFTSVGHVDGISTNVDESIATGKPISYFFPTVVSAATEPTPAPAASAPVAPVVTPRTIFLPASNATWTVYKLDKPPVHSNPNNIAGQLAPAKFNGLTYDILGTAEPDVYVIHTDSFGTVKIWAGQGSGAVLSGNAPLAAYPIPTYTSDAAPKPATPSYFTHSVVSGDTLSGLAVKYGTTVAEIKSLNGLTSDTIFIGQNLKIAGKATVTPPPAPVYYKVVSGDVVGKIAAKFGVSQDQIKTLNKLDSKYTIYVGETLRIK